MRVVAIVQARTGSTRLPGKVLMDIAGRTMLARVLERARRASSLDEVVVATTTSPGDEPVIAECERVGVPSFRGPEEDVLERYHRAARHFAADPVVRITADCPLIDPDEIDRVVEAFLEARPDYASNVLERTLPRGLETEVVSAAALAEAAAEATEPHQRVHVTPFLYEHPERFELLSVTGNGDHGHHRWTVDTADDLELVRALYDRGAEGMGWGELVDLVESAPELAALNAHVRQRHPSDG